MRRTLDLRSWEAASNRVREWEATGSIGVERRDAPTVASAVDQFMQDCKSRLKPPSVKKYRAILKKHLLNFCSARGITRLDQLDVAVMREFRTSWTFAPITQAKNIEFLRSFFRFCMSADWIRSNPAAAIKPPKHQQNPTLPLSDTEIKRLCDACLKWNGNGSKLRTLIRLMRFSGLRISDAVTLKREDVKAGRIFLYQAKTGTPVYVPVPPSVSKELKAVETDGDYFFWSGRGAVSSAIEAMRRPLLVVADLAGLTNVHFHRLRDSFAVALLQQGVTLEEVSILLGHSSIRITERHYSPWIRARQQRLEAAVRKAW